MKKSNLSAGYGYSTQIISHALWRYQSSTLSFQKCQALFVSQGMLVSVEMIHQWCKKHGVSYSKQIN
jgi:transposase-like protein